ncbi:MAG: hypothetical protein M3319_11390 [Actinomycetota bacterium]|nr:hypothetical protein [Actinomycetota bacterium]MDQ3901001.1 hypothetical protein [Actinomycetota bacterium]
MNGFPGALTGQEALDFGHDEFKIAAPGYVISSGNLNVGGVGQMLGQEPPVTDIDYGVTGAR